MTRPAARADRALGDYARFVARHATVLLFGLAVGLGGAVGLVAASKPTYAATAQVVLSVLPADPHSASGPPVSIDSDAQLVGSARVLQAAAESVGHPGGAAALHQQVEVRAVPTSRVLLITVSAADPTVAHRAAGAVVEELLSARRAIIASRLRAEQQALESHIADISSRLAALPAALEEDDAEITNPLGIEHSLFDDLSRLQQDLVSLLAERPDPGFVSEPPRLPAAPTRATAPMTIVSGTLLGLLGAATIGWGRDSLTALRARRPGQLSSRQLSSRQWSSRQ